ncbi:MAG: CHAT domain-containing protein [Planctomycetota bacterium]
MFRKVRLELLRHGPPYNQLLSPLTSYVALAGNHGSITTQFPFEHRHINARLSSFRYEGSDLRHRDATLAELALDISNVLQTIPGLAAELSTAGKTRPDFIHVNLVMSAFELSMIPFELTLSPHGCPGAGDFLLLQRDVPICITRQNRRNWSESLLWDRKPKILLVAACPFKTHTIPLVEHVSAIRKALLPWVPLQPETEYLHEISEYLTILPAATVKEVERQCVLDEYTHVHILAHGAPFEREGQSHFGLAFHSESGDSADVVSGDRLASIIGAEDSNHRIRNRLPSVVTIAACDAGNLGASVLGTGASVAHALHALGIPCVIASQFPITFAASVIMVKKLYQDLLWGIDPRRSLIQLRSSLFGRLKQTHDWASLVAYAAFPRDFDHQLNAFRSNQIRRSLSRQMEHRNILSISPRTVNRMDLDEKVKSIDLITGRLPSFKLSQDASSDELRLSAELSLHRSILLYLIFKHRDRSDPSGAARLEHQIVETYQFAKAAVQDDPSEIWGQLIALTIQVAYSRERFSDDFFKAREWCRLDGDSQSATSLKSLMGNVMLGILGSFLSEPSNEDTFIDNCDDLASKMLRDRMEYEYLNPLHNLIVFLLGPLNFYANQGGGRPRQAWRNASIRYEIFREKFPVKSESS